MSTENTMPTWARSPFERDAVALVSELRVEHPISRMFALTSAFFVRAREEGVATARAYVDLLAEALDWTDEQIDARLTAVVEPLIDRFFGPRPAVVGGECAVCLHALPQHEPTCIVVQWRSPAPTVEKARANFLRAVDADANPPPTFAAEEVREALGAGARGAIVRHLRSVADAWTKHGGPFGEAQSAEYARAARLVKAGDPVSTAAWSHDAFLLRLAVLSAEGHYDDGLDLLYSTIDDLLRAGRFVEVDALLASASERLYSPAILLGFLSTTWPAQDKLAFRAAFGQRVGAHLAETMKPARVEALLRGLLDPPPPSEPSRFDVPGDVKEPTPVGPPAALDLDAIEREAREDLAVARAPKVAAGPWCLSTYGAEPEHIAAPSKHGPDTDDVLWLGGNGSRADMALAARARTSVPERAGQALALCAVVRERDARIAALEADLESERRGRVAVAHARPDTLDAIIDQTQRELARRGQ